MATKDHYSSKKGRDSSFTLNNGTTTDYSTLVVQSRSEVSKKSNSFGGNEYPETKKDSHSWNEPSKVDAIGGLGKFGKFGESLSLKLKTVSCSDSFTEKARGNKSAASTIFGSDQSLTQLTSHDMLEHSSTATLHLQKSDLIAVALEVYLLKNLIDTCIEMDSSHPSFQVTIHIKEHDYIKLHFSFLEVLLDGRCKRMIIIDSAQKGTDCQLDLIFREGDLIFTLNGQDVTPDLLNTHPDPVHFMLKDVPSKMEIYRPKNPSFIINYVKSTSSSKRFVNASTNVKPTRSEVPSAPLTTSEELEHVPEPSAAGKLNRLKKRIWDGFKAAKEAVSCTQKKAPKPIEPPSPKK